MSKGIKKNIPYKDKQLSLFKEIGDYIKKPASHADRFGFFITTGETREEALKRAELIYQTVIPITC